MNERIECAPGDWVEVERVVLQPSERADGLPKDTARQPLKMWVKGFARGRARIGETVEIETMTGRLVEGTLTDVLPGYTHTFGRPPAELVAVGRDLRARVAEHRAKEGR